MSTAEKMGHGAANTHDWKVPMLMACNHFPRWKNADPEAIANRSLIFKHEHVVEDRDPTLPAQLDAQLPSIMFKAAWTYRCFARSYPKLSPEVPGMDYFINKMAEIRGAVSVDARFIAEVLTVDSSTSTSVAQLKEVYEGYKAECTSKEKSLSSWKHVKELLKSLYAVVSVNGEFQGVALKPAYVVQD